MSLLQAGVASGLLTAVPLNCIEGTWLLHIVWVENWLHGVCWRWRQHYAAAPTYRLGIIAGATALACAAMLRLGSLVNRSAPVDLAWEMAERMGF